MIVGVCLCVCLWSLILQEYHAFAECVTLNISQDIILSTGNWKILTIQGNV